MSGKPLTVEMVCIDRVSHSMDTLSCISFEPVDHHFSKQNMEMFTGSPGGKIMFGPVRKDMVADIQIGTKCLVTFAPEE